MHKATTAPDHRVTDNTVAVSQRHSRKTRVALLLSLLCGISLSGVFSGSAIAQSLDGQLNFLLNNNCSNIVGLNQDSTLGFLCSQISSLTGGGEGPLGMSVGGNAASLSQMAPSMIQDRLLDLRGGQTSAAMMMSSTAKADGGMGGGSEPDVSAPAGAEAKSKAAAKNSEGGIITPLSERLSLLISVEGEASDRDVTHFEDGYDSNILRFTAGLDSQFTDKFLAGVAFTYFDQNGDLHTGGDFENDSFGMLAYASFTPFEHFFLQATTGYASKGYKRTRMASFMVEGQDAVSLVTNNQRVKSDYNGNEVSGGVLLGYDLNKGMITFGPRASLDWIYTALDGYTEKGDTGLELKFQDTSIFSLQSRLGVAGSTAVSTGFGVLVPQMYVNWVHEFENDQRTENFTFIDTTSNVQYQYETEPPDRDFFELALGVSAVLPNGWQTYAQYRTILDHDYLDSHVGTLGMRIAF